MELLLFSVIINCEIAKVDKAKCFDSSRRNLLMPDRYDMYAGEFLYEIIKFGKSGIVLIDCKCHKLGIPVKTCRVVLKEDELIVL